MSDSSPRPYLWMLSGSFCFACMGVLANAAGGYFPWQLIAMTRSLVPLVLVVVWAVSAGVPLVFFRPGVLWMRSIAGSISLISTFYALSRLPPPEVFTVTNMFPLWVALLSWPMVGERPSLATWISVLCGVAGVFVIFPPTYLVHLPTEGEWPVLTAIIASIATAFAVLGLNQLRHVDARAVVVHFSFAALVTAAIAYFVFDRTPPAHSPNILALAVMLGTGLCAMVGQLFLTKAFASGEAAKVSVVNLAQIPITLVMQVLFLGYEFDGIKLIGMALVLGPTAWMMLTQRQRKVMSDE